MIAINECCLDSSFPKGFYFIWSFVVVQSLSCVHSFQPHGPQHARLPYALSPRVCSDSCPPSWYFQPSHPVAPFSSCPQSFPASGSFPVSRLFTSGGQSTRVWFLPLFTSWIWIIKRQFLSLTQLPFRIKFWKRMFVYMSVFEADIYMSVLFHYFHFVLNL